MSDKSEAVIHKALESLAKASPNSVVGDLMMLFPDDMVIKIISSFSGEIVKIPKVETVWRTYRNTVVRETLDTKNDRPNRDRLAAYFGISTEHVSKIYREERAKHERTTRSTVRRSARVAYRSMFDDMIKDARAALR